MKRQFLARTLTLVLLLAVSCKSTETASTVLSTTSSKSAFEAASIYVEEYGKNNDYRLLYNAAYSYIEAGDFDSALSLLNEGISYYPNVIKFHEAKAYVERELGLLDGYITTLSIIYELNPSNLKTSELYALALDGADRDEEAIKVSREILRRNSSNQTAIKILSKHFDFYKMYLKEEVPTSIEEKKEALAEPLLD